MSLFDNVHQNSNRYNLEYEIENNINEKNAFNAKLMKQLDYIIKARVPKTPILGSSISRCLEPGRVRNNVSIIKIN